MDGQTDKVCYGVDVQSLNFSDHKKGIEYVKMYAY